MPYVGREANSFTTVVDVTVSDDLTVTDDATIGGALSAKGGAVFNEDSVDVDFRVESNGEANMLFVDGGNDRVVMSKSSAGATTFPLVLTNPPNNSASTAVGLRFVPTNATIGDRTIDIVGSQTSAGGNAMELKFLVSNGGTAVERMRIHAAGTVSFNNGIELGSGLDATAANTLDDYEEGTWTPVMTGDGGSAGSASTTVYGARYTKTGNLVTVMCYIRFANIGSYSGNVAISGLPFTSANNGVRTAGTIDFLKRVELVDAFNYSGNIVPNTTVVQISRIVSDASVKTQAQVSAFNDNLNEIIFSCSYNA